MRALERRYRSLLRAYPGWYRADRGDEILGTLLEASGSGQSWPAVRDARALILGGLRVRARHHEHLSTAAAIRQAVLLAAVLELASWSSFGLGMFRGEWGHIFPSMLFAWVNLILGLLTLAAMAGAWFGRRAVAAVLALAAAGLWVYQPPWHLVYMAIEPVLALVVIAILACFKERLPRSWLWLAGVWYLLVVLPVMFGINVALQSVAEYALVGIVVSAIAWAVVDARLMLATTLAVAVLITDPVLELYARRPSSAFSWYLWPWFLAAVLGIALVLVAIWRVRRQAVL